MTDCPESKGHWPHTYCSDGAPTFCHGQGLSRRVFFGFPPKVVHAISVLRRDVRTARKMWRG